MGFKGVIDFLIGVLICAIIALFTVLITKIIANGLIFFLCLLPIPICANYFYKKDKKTIAYGTVFGLLPIGYLAFIIITISKLH